MKCYGEGIGASGAILLLLGVLVANPALAHGHTDEEWLGLSWPNQGGGLSNRRDAPLETKISKELVTSLSLKWTFHTKWDVSSTPAIDARRGVVYFPSWDGCQYAVQKDTGELIWKVNLTEIAPTIPGAQDAGPGGAGGGASGEMATDGERVFTSIINTDNKNFSLVPSSKVITWGGWVAINGTTGTILWSTANPAPCSTNPPMAHANGVVFGGSLGNATSGTPSGGIVALDSATGEILWSYTTQGGLGGGVSILDGCIFQLVGGSIAIFGPNPSPTIHGKSTIALCIS